MASPAIEVADLVKLYPKRDRPAVDGMTFTVPRGEVFGLLGPNGAGKSTTIGILTTRIRATGGRVFVCGIDALRDPVSARARLSVVSQHNNLDRALTPRQNLTYHAAYHGVGKAERNARAARLLTRFGLDHQADTKLDWYSGGMAQRLMLARSLIHEPSVLFLDEPTNGLDPQSRLLVRGLIRELRNRGVTVVLTTHEMNEAAGLVDRVGIVDHGRLIALDTPANLIRELAGQSVLDLTVALSRRDEVEDLLEALREVIGVAKAEQLPAPPAGPATTAAAGAAMFRAMAGPAGGGPRPGGFGAAQRERLLAMLAGNGSAGFSDNQVRLRLYLAAEAAATLGPVLAVLASRSATLADVHIGEPGLEDVFLNLTGREPR